MTCCNDLLGRVDLSNKIKDILINFETHYNDVSFKRGIFLYGSPGTGKTCFIKSLLQEMNYDVIRYDAGDVRNKAIIEGLTSHNISNQNVLCAMKGSPKKIAIVMDDIESMNSGDKGGLTSLIKLIRQKKTKKQKLESMCVNPIICISNYYVDKKIKELIKVCYSFELSPPTLSQSLRLIETIFPKTMESNLLHSMAQYMEGDLRKLDFFQRFYSMKPNDMTMEKLQYIFHVKHMYKDIKKITNTLLSNPMENSCVLDQHATFMNETDRTIVALLWHENIINHFHKTVTPETMTFYSHVLHNICYADYIDRITFQNQIWQFNEMSSLIKIFYNHALYHEMFPKVPVPDLDTIRFTKVLTKYSTEYNNLLFLSKLCMELNMDRKDVLFLFQDLKLKHKTEENVMQYLTAQSFFEKYMVSRLDIKRIYRYLAKNVVATSVVVKTLDEVVEDDGEEEDMDE